MCWITKEKRQAIYRRDDYTCAYCGRGYKSDRSRLTLDHIKPRKQGGCNKPTNLVTACDTCNTQKNNRTLGQYIAWLRVNVKVRNTVWVKKRVTKFRARKLQYA